MSQSTTITKNNAYHHFYYSTVTCRLFLQKQNPPPKCRRLLSSSTSTTKQLVEKPPSSLSVKLPQWIPLLGRQQTQGNKNTQGQNRWKAIARFVKYTRIPFLIVSIYGLGYQQGIVDYSRDPLEKQEVLLDSLLAGVGCTDRRKVHIFHEAQVNNRMLQLLPPNSKNMNQMTHRVGHVGRKIVAMAQMYVQDELKKAIAEAKEELPVDITPEQLYHILKQNEQVKFWDDANKRLTGGPWSFFLVETPIANAFVSEIVPQKIFMTTSMMSQFIHNDDELALVLGHEISHLILGHVSEANALETSLRTFEIVLLSLDPTDGLLSLALIGLLVTARKALAAAHSRENEMEADTLGMKLAAMACYDTHRASEVFYKMHLKATGSVGEGGGDQPRPSLWGGFLDSHPPSHERYQDLLRIASDDHGGENINKYKDTTCASVGTKLKEIIQGSSSGASGTPTTLTMTSLEQEQKQQE